MVRIRIRAAWQATLVPLMLVLGSCSDGQAGSARNDSALPLAPATSAGVDQPGRPTDGLRGADRAEPSPGSASGTLEIREDPCQSRERGIVGRIEYPMQKATDNLMSSPTGTSLAAARQISFRADQARKQILERCERPSPLMRQYLQVVRLRTSDALSYRDLSAVMDAYTRWAGAVGERRKALALRRTQEGCRALKRQVEANYRVWWAWTETGRTWWIELTYRSRLTRSLTATLSGRVHATGLVGRDRIWNWNGGRRSSGVLRWGGSSFDYGQIRPGESGQLVIHVNDPYVSTAANGTFKVEEVEVSTDIPGARRWWCSLPVREES